MASRHGCAGSNLCMRESKLNGVFFLLALLLVWELAARAEWVNPLIVPAVSKIVGTFSELLWSGQIPLQTLAEPETGGSGVRFGGGGVAIPLGIFMGLFDKIRDALNISSKCCGRYRPPWSFPRRCYSFGLEDGMKIFASFSPVLGRFYSTPSMELRTSIGFSCIRPGHLGSPSERIIWQ